MYPGTVLRLSSKWIYVPSNKFSVLFFIIMIIIERDTQITDKNQPLHHCLSDASKIDELSNKVKLHHQHDNSSDSQMKILDFQPQVS